jgi:Zn-dependent peptidase ImmA (M78 family)
MALLTDVAEVRVEDWKFDCDAIAVGLAPISGDERPAVFVKKDIPYRRFRFTLAHELGHIRLGWHIGVLSCKPSYSEFSLEPTAPLTRETLRTGRLAAEMEGEATRFASHLLIPQSLVEAAASSTDDVGKTLEALEMADVSALAAVMRLSQCLLPGFLFEISEEDSWRTVRSSGTHVPSSVRRGKKLTDHSHSHGSLNFAGRKIRWYQFSSFQSSAVTSDPRSATDLLRAAIAKETTSSLTADQLFLKINGVVGGMLSRDRFSTEDQALAILEQRFASETGYRSVTDSPEFAAYLKKKATERLTAKRRTTRTK